MKLLVVVWGQHRIVLIRHLLIRLMVSGSTFVMISDILPLAHRIRMMIMALVKPMEGPAERTTARIAAVISFPCICYHLVVWCTLDIGLL